MLTEFGQVFIFILLAVVFVAMGLITNWLIRPARPTPEKQLIYECGEDTAGPAHLKFNIRFYVIALAFLLFDLEFVMLFPWATVFGPLGPPAFWLGMVFLVVLIVGDLYLWKKGDLDWVLPPVVKPRLDLLVSRDRPRFRPPAPTPAKQPEPADVA